MTSRRGKRGSWPAAAKTAESICVNPGILSCPIEVYLIQDQIQNVLYDISCVYPDLEADYAFGSVSTVELVSTYDASISKGLVRSTSMYNAYSNYL
ncbi:hypothetical protein VB005_09039 [Metarhizium brunneum]